MDFFELREPVNSWTHLSWLLLSVPATWYLWQRSQGDRGKQLSLLVYGLSLAACFGSSALFHGAQVSPGWLEGFDRLDHIAIYLLIAGSYTPMAWSLMRGRSRWLILGTVWSVAMAGAVRISTYGTLSPVLSTGVYLIMGWGALFCCFHIARTVSHRAIVPLVLGGVLYSVGAVLNVIQWPVLWPGVVQSHEIFHVFVMGGSLAHFSFMVAFVVPAGTEAARPFATARHSTVHSASHLPAIRGRGARLLWATASRPWFTTLRRGSIKPGQ